MGREWDAKGHLALDVLQLDESGSRTAQRYDSRGHLVPRLLPGAGSRSTTVKEERFEYDEADRLVLRIQSEWWKNNWTGEDSHCDARGPLAPSRVVHTCECFGP